MDRRPVVAFQEVSIRSPLRRGATAVTHEILAAMVARGVECWVIAGASDGRRDGQPRVHRGASGVTIVELGVDQGSVHRAIADFTASPAFQRIIGPLPPMYGLAEANWLPFDTPAWSVGFPISTMVHHYRYPYVHMPSWDLPAGGTLLDEHARTGAHMLAVSDFTAGELRSRGLVNVDRFPIALPRGLDVRRLRIATERPEVVWAGAFSPEKRPELALEIFERVRVALPGLKLHMVGALPDDPRHPYAWIRERYRNSDDVEIHGWVTDAALVRLYAGALMLWNTSDPLQEGFGLALAEAALQGCRPLAPPGGGAAEAAARLGGIVTASDSADDMVAAARRWTTVLWKSNRLGSHDGTAVEARLPVATTSWDVVAREVARAVERAHRVNGPATAHALAYFSLPRPQPDRSGPRPRQERAGRAWTPGST